jgi:hypothetical protein
VSERTHYVEQEPTPPFKVAPAITDGQRVYLVGFEAVYGLDPK